jgi:hypothetical protein
MTLFAKLGIRGIIKITVGALDCHSFFLKFEWKKEYQGMIGESIRSDVR